MTDTADLEQRLRETYRGHDIEVSREESLGAGELTYFSIYRASDGYECVCNFTYGEDPLPDVMQSMRELVDEALSSDDPWDERADEEELGGYGLSTERGPEGSKGQ